MPVDAQTRTRAKPTRRVDVALRCLCVCVCVCACVCSRCDTCPTLHNVFGAICGACARRGITWELSLVGIWKAWLGGRGRLRETDFTKSSCWRWKVKWRISVCSVVRGLDGAFPAVACTAYTTSGGDDYDGDDDDGGDDDEPSGLAFPFPVPFPSCSALFVWCPAKLE